MFISENRHGKRVLLLNYGMVHVNVPVIFIFIETFAPTVCCHWKSQSGSVKKNVCMHVCMHMSALNMQNYE